MNQEEFNRLWEESGRKQEAMMADVRSKPLSNEDKELLNSVILQRWLDGSDIIDNDESEPDEERAKAFVSAQQWIFAKTMADIPHFYCLKENSPDAAEFDWLCSIWLPTASRERSTGGCISTSSWVIGSTGLWTKTRLSVT